MRWKYKAAALVIGTVGAAGTWFGVVHSPPGAIGSDNTVVNAPMPPSMGSGNTIVGATDGNTAYNRGGTSIGDHACADPTSVAIGAHANAGACGHKQ